MSAQQPDTAEAPRLPATSDPQAAERADGPPVTDPAGTAMRELLAGNRRRRRIRRWVGIASIPLALAAALLVVKILGMYGFAHQSIRAFLATDFPRTVTMAQWQGALNWFEPYKADYNLGTGLAELGELEPARAALERALPRAPGLEVCAVRYNLATVVERQGDRATDAGEIDRGQELYREALEILGAAPEGCGRPEADAQSPDRDRSMSDSQKELARRIMEKLRQQSQSQNPEQNPEQNPDSDDEPPQPQGPSESQLDELEQKLQEGAQERQDREQGETGGSGGGGTDRPW